MVHSRTVSISDTSSEEAPTVPGAPAERLEDDEDHQALIAHAAEARAFLVHRAWDNLAHIERFVVGAALASRVMGRFDDSGTRRHLVNVLWPMLPAAMRARPWQSLPADVQARAPSFFLQPGDVPNIAPVYSAFLADLDIESLFVAPRLLDNGAPDAPPFLAPRSVCPGAAQGSCAAVFLEERISAIPTSLPPTAAMPGIASATWRCGAVGADNQRVRVRIGPDGQPMRTVDGREEPVTLTTDVLAAWLLSAGPDARGLDLRGEDDRALLLAWAHALRTRRVVDSAVQKSVFEWLEDESATPAVRARVVEQAIQCAVDVVARFTLDPLACRFVLRGADADGGWTERAAEALDSCALFHDVSPRERAPEGKHARDIVWLDALLRPGFACGRLTPLSAGRAFARLATSVLAPLGVLPSSGVKDGTGAVLLQRIFESDGGRVERSAPRLVSFGAEGAVDEPLFGDAWAHGRGQALPDPKGAPRHDVTAMPAWLAFFLEGLS